MEHYDIFISYRRDGGFETAKHLYVKAKEFIKVQVPLGEHVFEYVSIQDSSQRYSEVHALNEVKNYVIQIKIGKHEDYTGTGICHKFKMRE